MVCTRHTASDRVTPYNINIYESDYEVLIFAGMCNVQVFVVVNMQMEMQMQRVNRVALISVAS